MRPLDFPLMIQELSDSGFTLSDISAKTGLAISTIGLVKNETIEPPAAWAGALALLDLYLLTLGTPPKLYPEMKK